jgi:hypothetical protein
MVLGFKSQTPDIWVVTTRLEQGCWWHLPPQKQFLPRGYFLKVYLGSNVFKLRIRSGVDIHLSGGYSIPATRLTLCSITSYGFNFKPAPHQNPNRCVGINHRIHPKPSKP